jgi:hypothetical protein
MSLSAQKRPALLALLLLVSSAVAVGGPIWVSPVVTQDGSIFHYNYTISNGTGLDLAVLDITVRTGLAISGLEAPFGFEAAYDPGLGLVSFLENTAVFGATPLSGFAFNASLGPSSTSFTGTLVDANSNLSTMSGSTTGPAGAGVPEPGSLYLLAGGASLTVLYRRRVFRCVAKS